MAVDNTEPQEVDLERTDRLPILNLNPVLIDEDVADDAVRLDMTTVTPRIKNEFRRASLDLPSLVESVRSAEERISRQKADFDALSQAHEKLRAAEAAAIDRVNALTAELTTLRSALETEQTHAGRLSEALAEKNSAIDVLRPRLEDAQQEIEGHQVEARMLRDTLVARDATIVQILHSLGERDAQLSALQREHARLLPALEERSRTGASLQTELRSAVSRADALATDLRSAQASVATLTGRIKTNELELVAVRRELNNVKLVAEMHQERLRTREWREGFDQNQVQDLDAKLHAAQADRAVLKSTCDELRQRVSELESKLATRDQDELQRTQEKLAIAERAHAALRDEAARLQVDLRTREEELARRAPESAGIETTHLMNELAAKTDELAAKTDELAAKAKTLDQVKEENRHLNTILERTRGALEEREFLIRRLERSETNNATALGRIQTSIERMGSAPSLPSGAVAPTECMAEMVRIDGENRSTHTLGRRTRIGRAPGCEIQVDSSSVSRHHALLLVGMREVIVEDLNSTNGVLVNGRKVARELLSDGDTLTIGDARFKLSLKLDPQPPEA